MSSHHHVVELPDQVRSSAALTVAGRQWLQDLPARISRAQERWGLQVDRPYPAGSVSWCAQARLPNGEPAVLKLAMPHAEARHEATALRWGNGHGAIRLIDDNPDDWALLLERAEPGLPMRSWRGPVEQRLVEAGELLARFVNGPSGRTLSPTAVPSPMQVSAVPDLAEVGAMWAGLIRDRAADATASGVSTDPALIRDAVAVFEGVAPGSRTVVHGDANPGNLLRHHGRWLAIDPKPMRGPLAYDLWPLVGQLGGPLRKPEPVRVLTTHLRLVAEAAGVDPVQGASWALARSVESAFWEWDHYRSPYKLHRELAVAALWRSVRDEY